MKIYPTENHIRFSFNSKGVDINEVICKANQNINMESQVIDAKKYYNVEYDYELEGDGAKLFILDHSTTQGIVIGKDTETEMQIVIPALSSEADIAYAFSLLHALKELYPALSIQKDDAISELSDKGIAQTIAHCRNNMRIYLTTEVDEDDYEWGYIIRGYRMGTEITIDMLKRQYSISDEEVDIDQMVDLSFSILCRLQWLASILPHAGHSQMPAKLELNYYDDIFDDDDYPENVVTILNENLFINVSWSEIILLINGKYKPVSHEDFYTAALACNKIEVLTHGKYAISEMAADEWKNFCESIPGKLFEAPKTYILRWNPTVSDFTRRRYYHHLEEYGDNLFFSWSIYDWEQAKEGDRCYMLLEGTGEEHPGIIFTGEICCDPYPDIHWKSIDTERYYIDADCRYLANIDQRAWISTQQLETEIPDFDWRHGHSGELLTVEQAEKLEKLWCIVRTQIDREKFENDEY